jgi:hypothetical protein
MIEFNKDQIETQYEALSEKRQGYLDTLEKIVVDSGKKLEGNCFYWDLTLNLHEDLYTKQLNLFWCGKQAQTKLCEIGFNGGHSAMLLLLGRDTQPLDFTVFDIGHHAYTKPCLHYMQSQFPDVQFEYIEGNSIHQMPNWIQNHQNCISTYDVVHVDGGHSQECILSDTKNADILLRVGGILIIDDTNLVYINDTVDVYLATKRYIELDVLKTKGYPHRILQKIQN